MFVLPTLKEWAERSRQAFRANLKGSDAWVWPNNVYASAKVIAGMMFELSGFADYISRQKFAHTAPDIESLLMHGEEFGIPRKPASPAYGTILITTTSSVTVTDGALLQRADQVQFRVISGGQQVTAGTLELDVVAVTDGKTTNTLAGTPLAVVSGVTGDASIVVGAGGVVLGADVEDMESYRARILFRKRNPPHGGSAADYVIWASSVSGVSRVFVERLWAGAGTVRVFILMDDVYPDGIPTGADAMRVKDFLETVRPAGARVSVTVPTARPVDVTIQGLVPDTVAVREAVMAELRDAFHRVSRVSGNDTEHAGMAFLATPAAFSRSWLWQAVANATGEQRHKIAAPGDDVNLARGEIAVLGTVTFI